MKLTDNIRRANAERLRSYFAQDGALTGLRSVHGPLVDMALAGVGTGSREQERGVNGMRFTEYRRASKDAIPTPHAGLVAQHRETHGAFLALTFAQQSVLAAAYGNQRRWHPQVKEALESAFADLQDRGHRGYRDSIGSCTLHPRIQRGMQDVAERGVDLDECEDMKAIAEIDISPAMQKRKAAKKRRMMTGVVVWLPGSKAFKRGTAEASEIEIIARDTARDLDDAHHAFADKMGMFKPKRQPAQKRKPREAPIVERVWPMEAM